MSSTTFTYSELHFLSLCNFFLHFSGAEVAAEKSLLQAEAAVKTTATEEHKERAEGERAEAEEEEEEEEDSDDDEEGSISDDPDRLWCICKKPHNDRSVAELCTYTYNIQCACMCIKMLRTNLKIWIAI